MFKIWIKNRMIYDFIVAVVLSLLFTFVFVFPSNKTCETIENENFIYLNSEIDFQIPNPSIVQLGEIKDKTFINNTFGYYLTKINIKGTSTSKVNLIMSDNMNNLSFTMYNEKTKLSSITNTANYAYLDEKAANTLGVKCGDEIIATVAGENVKFIVCAIYQTNTLFAEGTVLVDFTGDIKSIYETNVSSNGYSGAFIDASNELECDDYLKNYIPMGRLKERSEFDSEEAYNTYTESIMNANYSNEISKFFNARTIALNELENATKERSLLIYIGSIVVGLCWGLISFILRKRKSENKLFKEVIKNKKSIGIYRICTFVFGTGVYAVVNFMLQTSIDTLSLTTIPLFISIALFMLSYFMDNAQDKSYIKAKAK